MTLPKEQRRLAGRRRGSLSNAAGKQRVQDTKYPSVALLCVLYGDAVRSERDAERR